MMSDYVPLTRAVKSETFFPPLSGSLKRGDASLIKAQAADRERIVCSVGLHIHYQVDRVVHERGAHESRMMGFNPAVHGPPCPYPFTGKIPASEAEHISDDPLTVARKIEALTPYDQQLYKRYDPRRISKTVVVRDYGCKIPIDIASTEQIAQAVLNVYPDQYLTFLKAFVSNIFGTAMRTYLANHRAGLQRILDEKIEMNRVAWSAFVCVNDLINPSAAVPQTYAAHVTAGYHPPYSPPVNGRDVSLHVPTNVAAVLAAVYTNGTETASSLLTASDVYDIIPCLKQHIVTLDEMIDKWCRGFGSKERYVTAMLWWCNEQGRNRLQDLKLIRHDEQPRYEDIMLNVPYNLWQDNTLVQPKGRAPHDMRSSVCEPEASFYKTASVPMSVGQWTGSGDTPNVILGAAKASPYVWGWGHSCVLVHRAQSVAAARASAPLLQSPCLQYTNDGTLRVLKPDLVQEYTRGHRGGKVTEADLVVGRRMRDALSEDPTADTTISSRFYKGIDPAYRHAVSMNHRQGSTQANRINKEGDDLGVPEPMTTCDNGIDLIRSVNFKCNSKKLNPFFSVDNCYKITGTGTTKALIDGRVFGGFTFHQEDQVVREILSVYTPLRLQTDKIPFRRLFPFSMELCKFPLGILLAYQAQEDRFMQELLETGDVTALRKHAISAATQRRVRDVRLVHMSRELPKTNLAFDEITDKDERCELRIIAIRTTLCMMFGWHVACHICMPRRTETLEEHLKQLVKGMKLFREWWKSPGSRTRGSPAYRRFLNFNVASYFFHGAAEFGDQGGPRLRNLLQTLLNFEEYVPMELISFGLFLSLRSAGLTPPPSLFFAPNIKEYLSGGHHTLEQALCDNLPNYDPLLDIALGDLIGEYETYKGSTTSNEPTYGRTVTVEATISHIQDTPFPAPRKLYPEPFSNRFPVPCQPVLRTPTLTGNGFSALIFLDDAVNHNGTSGNDPLTGGTLEVLRGDAQFNINPHAPQLFAMLDAAGVLWNRRAFTNSSCCDDHPGETDQCTGQHYWCRTYIESFVASREQFKRDHKDKYWEEQVKLNPKTAFPREHIGQLCERTWKEYFPLLPPDHELRDDLRRARALNVLWGELPVYSPNPYSHTPHVRAGAWMPLSVSHQMRLYRSVGLFDETHRIPLSPWSPHTGRTSLHDVFFQSYHNPYYCDSYRAKNFKDWINNAVPYQKPRPDDDNCYYPFSQYGGTPVEADFVPHAVHKHDNKSSPNDDLSQARYDQIVSNRFGIIGALRIGNQYHDTGLLQDMFAFQYRKHADLSKRQMEMKDAKCVYVSNFMAYARNHAILALASCNHGTDDVSETRMVRNLYRMYVDTYKCMGSNADDETVPVIMGFLAQPDAQEADGRPVTLYAGSLVCINAKMEQFCASSANSNGRVCPLYKQTYLNDAALLHTRLLRQERRRILHYDNWRKAQLKRNGNFKWDEFKTELIDLQDAYIDFLQTTVLGMLMEMPGADMSKFPLHLLEPRELEVSLLQEDTDLIGNDFLTPRTQEIIQASDFGPSNLTKTQLAILSLVPPNFRIMGTMHYARNMQTVDLEHIRQRVMQETHESNMRVPQRYAQALVSGALAQKLLEVDGPMDLSFDLNTFQDPGAAFKDPLVEANRVVKRVTPTQAQTSSSLSLGVRGEKLRSIRRGDSQSGLNIKETHLVLEKVRAEVERHFVRNVGARTRREILAKMDAPDFVKRTLRDEY